MNVTIFRKKVTPRNGNKPFFKYITTLTNKAGENVYCDVHFTEGCNIPQNFPAVCEIDKRDANMTTKSYTYTDTETGEEKTAYRHNLWINAVQSTTDYIDTSLDDFE